MNKFKVGDKIVAMHGAPYSITCEGNGYGIVIDDVSSCMNTKWIDKTGKKWGKFSLNPKYFKLKTSPIRDWKKELSSK